MYLFKLIMMFLWVPRESLHAGRVTPRRPQERNPRLFVPASTDSGVGCRVQVPVLPGDH